MIRFTRVLMGALGLAMAVWGGAHAHASSADWRPDTSFLKEGPNAKTKQVVRLNGIDNPQQFEVVRGALDDVVVLVRLFGVSGSNLGDISLPGASPERMQQLREGRDTWQVFRARATPKGQGQPPVPPASGHQVTDIGSWQIESAEALSVSVSLRQFAVDGYTQRDAPTVTARLRFVKLGGLWLYDGQVPSVRP